MHSLPSVGLATSTPIRGPHAGSAPLARPPTPPTVCGVLAGPRLAPVEGAGGKTEKKLINHPEIILFLH